MTLQRTIASDELPRTHSTKHRRADVEGITQRVLVLEKQSLADTRTEHGNRLTLECRTSARIGTAKQHLSDPECKSGAESV